MPKGYKSDPQLGNRVKKQRCAYAMNNISSERVEHLDELGCGWNTREAAWEKRLAQLKAYRNLHGDCLVSQYDNDIPGLGKWVARVRQSYHKFWKGGSGDDKITDERIAELEPIGFVWKVPRRCPITKRKNCK